MSIIAVDHASVLKRPLWISQSNVLIDKRTYFNTVSTSPNSATMVSDGSDNHRGNFQSIVGFSVISFTVLSRVILGLVNDFWLSPIRLTRYLQQHKPDLSAECRQHSIQRRMLLSCWAICILMTERFMQTENLVIHKERHVLTAKKLFRECSPEAGDFSDFSFVLSLLLESLFLNYFVTFLWELSLPWSRPLRIFSKLVFSDISPSLLWQH